MLVLVFAQTTTLGAGVVMLMLCGFAQSLTMVWHTVILLSASTPRYRGRIMGVRMLAIYSLPLGLLVAGLLIGWVGFRTTASIYCVLGLVFFDRGDPEPVFLAQVQPHGEWLRWLTG